MFFFTQESFADNTFDIGYFESEIQKTHPQIEHKATKSPSATLTWV